MVLLSWKSLTTSRLEARDSKRGIAAVMERCHYLQGCFSKIYHYHICILMHLAGIKARNMPHYLLKSLTRMAVEVHKQKNFEITLFRHGLVKIIVIDELRWICIPWGLFLQRIRTKPRTTVFPVTKKLATKGGEGYATTDKPQHQYYMRASWLAWQDKGKQTTEEYVDVTGADGYEPMEDVYDALEVDLSFRSKTTLQYWDVRWKAQKVRD